MQPDDVVAAGFGPLDPLWNILKLLFALSPLIGMVILFVVSYDDEKAEKEKRNEVYEFQLAGEE